MAPVPEFVRKPNRLAPESYRGCRAYFLTICTDRWRKLLTGTNFIKALITLLGQTCRTQGRNVYAYCFMPDHLHLVLTGEPSDSSLPRFVQAFKSLGVRESWRHDIKSLWQKGFYDHLLRGSESMDAAAWYVFLNPVRAGLVQRAEDWPHSGSFVFTWPGLRTLADTFVPPWKMGKTADIRIDAMPHSKIVAR